jgi:hypothetical protein
MSLMQGTLQSNAHGCTLWRGGRDDRSEANGTIYRLLPASDRTYVFAVSEINGTSST